MSFNANVETKKTRHPKWLILLLTGAMLLSPLYGFTGTVHASGDEQSQPALTAAATAPALKQVDEEIITSGARLVKYQYTTPRAGKSVPVNMNAIVVDLSNPYVKLDTMNGQQGKLNSNQSVVGMTKDTGAVAGINGDYFTMNLEGAPLGGDITSGEMISSPSDLKGMYAFAVTEDGKPVIDEYEFEGTARGSNGETFPLAGINKATYMTEPDKQYSHANTMYIYTSAWKNKERPKNSSTTPTEALVQNGVVTDFSDGSSLDMSVPEGAYILRGHGKAAEYMRQNMQVGMPVAVDYHLVSETTGKEVDPDSFQMMIGGHTLLVQDGKASSFTRDTGSISGDAARARTAVGYSKDNRYVYMVTAEKNDNSSGLTLKEFQQALVQMGVWKAVNLDGGGSTQMVTRPLGDTDTKLTHNTEDGASQRRVVNGLGVFSIAPKGEVKGMQLSGPNRLFIGQNANYSFKAYDQYYNPVDSNNMDVKWSASDDRVAWNGTSFTAKKSGKTQVIAKSGNATSKKDVEVIGSAQIKEMSIGASGGPLQAGAKIAVPVKVKLMDGSTATLPNESIKWEFQGFSGSVTDGVLTIDAVSDNTKVGYAFASYDGVKTMIPLTLSSEQMVDNFNKSTIKPSFAGLPKESTFGEASIVSGYDGREAADKVVKLSYDMTGDTADKFAYAMLNGATGIKLPAGTTSFSVDVYGDNSNNWLRAKLVDANGKQHLVDVANVINWDGWQTFEVDVASLGVPGPVTLERLYVVNLAAGQDERSSAGEIAFDNIKAKLPAGGSVALPKAEMKLTVNSKQAKVNDKDVKLDVAPIVLNGTTYVPVKVILDAFGGNATWNNEAKRVSILRGDSYLELRVDQKTYWNNGKRSESEVAPIIRSNRTLVPLRLVSEQLGLQVNWDQKTKSITIR
ncbi:stalk domain-containing protein [Paenibacillus marinisediminis]